MAMFSVYFSSGPTNDQEILALLKAALPMKLDDWNKLMNNNSLELMQANEQHVGVSNILFLFFLLLMTTGNFIFYN